MIPCRSPSSQPAGFVTYTSDAIHHTQLTALKPATKYFYKVAGGTAVESFSTLPAVGPIGFFSFVAIGDLGQTADSALTVQHALTDEDAKVVLLLLLLLVLLLLLLTRTRRWCCTRATWPTPTAPRSAGTHTLR